MGDMRRRAWDPRLRALGLLLMTVSFGAATTGCAKARAATQPELPLLDAPPPPPRVIVAADVEVPPPAPVIAADDESLPPPSPRSAPAISEPSRPTPPGRAEREPEREAAKPEESRPNRTLQTPASGSESERTIRDRLARAGAELARVDYRSLTANLKEQYDTSKRFIQQSEDALKARNLVYAATLADKAAEIAEKLPRR